MSQRMYAGRGNERDTFVERYESMQPTFTQFSRMLEDYAKLIEAAAIEMQETVSSTDG